MPHSARRARGRLLLKVFGAILLGPLVWALALLALPRPTALARLQAVGGDVTLSKSVAQTSVGPGGALTYTLAVTASGAPASGIRLTDTLPSGLTWITDTAEAAGLSRLSTAPPVWTLPDLITDSVVSFTLAARVPISAALGTGLVNQAAVSAATGDAETSNNTAQAGPVGVVGVDMRLGLTGPDTSPPGRTISYRLPYTNSGNLAAASVVVTQSLPSYVNFETATGSGAWSPATRIVTWNVGSVGAGAAATLAVTGTVSATAPRDAVLTSRAHVSAPGDVDLSNNDAARATTVVFPPAQTGTLALAGTAVVGRPITLTASLRDAQGLFVPDGTVVTFSVPPPATITPSAVTTGGQATAILQTTRSGPVTVSAASGNANPTLSLSVDPGAAAQLTFSGPGGASVGQSVTLTGWVSDTYGNAVAPTAVQFTQSGVGQLSAASATTVNGRATTAVTSQTSGQAQVTARVGARQSTASVQFSPLAPATLALEALGAPTASVPLPVRAVARDQYQNRVSAGHLVNFSVLTGTGNLAPTTPTTDATGTATTTLNTTVAGALTVRAQAGQAWADAPLDVAAGPVVALRVTASPSSVSVDGGQTTLTIRSVDKDGNWVKTYSGAVNLSFTSALTGVLSSAAPVLSGGTASVTLTAPNSYSSQGLVVQASRQGLTAGSATIPLLPADVTVRLDTSPPLGAGGYRTPGEQVTYTITYSNTGQATARNVFVEGTLMDHFLNPQVTLPSGVTTARTPGSPGEAWRWVIGSLAPGQRDVITIRGQIDPTYQWPSAVTLQSDATVTTSTAQRAPGGSPDSASLLLPIYTVDLRVDVTPPDDLSQPWLPGNTVNYRVFLANAGLADARDARITVTLPISTAFVSWEEYWPQNPGAPPGYLKLINPTTGQPTSTCASECVWTYKVAAPNPPIASVNSNASIRLSLRIATGAKPGAAVLRFLARIGGPLFDSNTSNNLLIITSDLWGMNLTAEGSSPGAVTPGQTVTLVASVVNRGRQNPYDFNQSSATANGSTVIVNAPAQLQFVDASPAPSNRNGNVVTWTFPEDLPPDGARSVTMRVRVPDSPPPPINTIYTTTVQVSSPTAESFTADNRKDVATRVIAAPPNRIALDPSLLTLAVDQSAVVSLQIFDPYNNPVPSWDMAFAASPSTNPPPFTIAPPAGRTGANGTVTATVTAGAHPGDATFIASMTSNGQGYTASRPIRIVPGSPFTTTVNINRTLAAGVTTPFVATFTDRYGNFVTDGTVVTLTATLGGFDVGGTPQQVLIATTQGGRVERTFASGTRAGLARVSACADAHCDARPVSILPGPATQVSLSLDRIEVAAGDAPIEATAIVGDAYNNPVLDNNTVQFSLSGCASASLQATSAQTVGGRATVGVIGGTQACQGQVTATIPAAASNRAFRVVPAAPHRLRVTAPATLLASGAHTATIHIELTDAYSNGISSPVTLGLNPALGDLDPEVAQTLNGIGTATLTAPHSLGTTLVTAQAGPLTASAPVQFVAGPPAVTTLSPTKPSLAADGQSQAALVISARDAYNNVVSSPISLASNLGTTLTPSVGTLTNGVFTTLIRSGTVAGTGVLTVSIGSLVTTYPVRLLAGPPVVVIPNTSRVPPRLVADGIDHMTVSARLLDQYGNPVENGTPVNFSLAAPLGTFSPPQAGTTDGVVTTTLTASTTIGVTDLIVAAGSRQVRRSVEFTIGPPARVNVVLAPSVITGTGEISATVQVTAEVLDRVGRPVAAGTPVTFATDQGSFDGAGASITLGVTAEGKAGATLRIPPTRSSVRVTAEAGGVTGAGMVFIGSSPYRIHLPILQRATNLRSP